MKNFQNILVVRTDRVGDVVLTTPAVHALRQNFPSARLTLLVARATQELLQGHPDVDEVLVDDRQGKHKGVGYFALVNLLRQKRFDLAVVFHTKKRTNLLCWLAGIPYRLGYRDNKFGFLLTRPVKDDRAQGLKHEAQYCCDVLTDIGIDCQDLTPRIFSAPEHERWAREFLVRQGWSGQKPLLAIHVGASDPTKEWPVKYFAELIRGLREKYNAGILLIGTAALKSRTDELKQLCAVPLIDAVGQTSLGQLMGLLKQCQALVSNDSGPVHVADALGVGVVSIFTRNQPGINPQRWRPLGSKSGFAAPPVQPEISFAKGQIEDQQYLETVTTQQVLTVVDRVLKLC